jgi:hypothetical protein
MACHRIAAVILGILLLPSRTPAAEIIVRALSTAPGEQAQACEIGRGGCTFSDTRGENRYVVTDQAFVRSLDGQEAFKVPIAGGIVRARLAAMNRARTQLAVVLAQEAVPTAALLNGPGSLSPETVQRKFTLTILNPKTGAEIKGIDLGMLKPDGLSLTPAGDFAWITGEELQLRRREVRAYNTRSGALEHVTPSARNVKAQLFDSGFAVGGTFYGVESARATAGGVRRHTSANPYSIAEFAVRVATPLQRDAVADQAVAVIAFEGVDGDVREMLESTLAVKLGAAGLRLVERKRIKELLQEAQFQNLGITDSKSAAQLGRMANARLLAFGSLRRTGSITVIALRVTGVEDGVVHAAVELECRDCTPDDYVQGVGFLVNDWVERQ